MFLVCGDAEIPAWRFLVRKVWFGRVGEGLADRDMTVAAGQNTDLQVRTGFVVQPGPDAGGEIAPREIAAKTDRNGIPRRFRS